jgi:8-oxo-dGTP pyrophosphatase MutT (NUDIX family)
MVDSASPVRWAASGVLITGPDGLTLLVRTHNRTGLVLPGGMVEAEEPPATAAEREVLEELGLVVRVTRLLTVQHRPGQSERPALRLQAEEIAEAFWLTPDEALSRHVGGGTSRLDAAFAARRTGSCVYLDDERTIPENDQS